jgi:hypothetical protein
MGEVAPLQAGALRPAGVLPLQATASSAAQVVAVQRAPEGDQRVLLLLAVMVVVGRMGIDADVEQRKLTSGSFG